MRPAAPTYSAHIMQCVYVSLILSRSSCWSRSLSGLMRIALRTSASSGTQHPHAFRWLDPFGKMWDTLANLQVPRLINRKLKHRLQYITYVEQRNAIENAVPTQHFCIYSGATSHQGTSAEGRSVQYRICRSEPRWLLLPSLPWPVSERMKLP